MILPWLQRYADSRLRLRCAELETRIDIQSRELEVAHCECSALAELVVLLRTEVQATTAVLASRKAVAEGHEHEPSFESNGRF